MKLPIGFLLIGFWISSMYLQAQNITGTFSQLKNQTIYLEGFKGFSAYTIDSTQTDANGNFKLTFIKEDYGMGYLKFGEFKPLLVILANEDTEIIGEAPDVLESIVYAKGSQNIAFSNYATQQPKREQALNAWNYLDQLYQQDVLFKSNKMAKDAMIAEMTRIKNEDALFVKKLPTDSYVRWFLPIRKLVSNVSVVAQSRPEDILATRESLRAINYADPRLYKSGLFREAIENHVWFIENSSGDLDAVFADLNKSIDGILGQLANNEKLFNEVTDYLFNLLEKRSLFTSAEYLSHKVLSESTCTLATEVSRQLEAYRKMAVGETAADITFTEFTYFPSGVSSKKMSEIPADYYLVVFAAGWCSHCNEEMPKVAQFYPEWKALNIEVILVALDENEQDFAKFAAPFPFISTTDYKKWDNQAATDYFVNGTPSFFLLGKDRKIILRPKNADHVKAWVDWKVENNRK